MYHYGGLYTDLDFILVKPLDDLFNEYNQYDIMLFEEWYKSINIENKDSAEGSLHNGFLLSKPKNVFWLKMINQLITNASQIITKNDVWKLSGTNLLRNMYMKHEDDLLISYQPYYKVCPFKCIDKIDKNNVIICDNKEVTPLDLKKSHWSFFNIHEVVNKNDGFLANSHAVLVGVGSLWNN